MNEEKEENEDIETAAGAEATDTRNAEDAAAVSEGEAPDGAASEADVAEGNELEILAKQVAALEKERDEFKDQYLRKCADFDNYRKRMIKEKQDAFDYANTSLLKDLLDSLDNFDRTVEAASSANDAKSIADGVKMINKGLVSMLENKYELVSYGQPGDAFDPDLHEAIGKSDDPVAEPVIKAVYLKGYKLKDRVIRHAKVMVSMPDGSVEAPKKDEAAGGTAAASESANSGESGASASEE